MVDSIEGAVGIYLASFVIAIISGAFPLVNAEVYLVGIVVASNPSPAAIVLLGIIIACGQMISHTLLFHAAHGVANLAKGNAPGTANPRSLRRRERLEAQIVKARERVARWGNKRFALLVTSATLGVPPFLLTCVAAGALEIPYRWFATVGLAGRIVRFVTIALIAALV